MDAEQTVDSVADGIESIRFGVDQNIGSPSLNPFENKPFRQVENFAVGSPAGGLTGVDVSEVPSGGVHQFNRGTNGSDRAGFADRIGPKNGSQGIGRQFFPLEGACLYFLDGINNKKDKQNGRSKEQGCGIGQRPISVEHERTFVRAQNRVETQKKPADQKNNSDRTEGKGPVNLPPSHFQSAHRSHKSLCALKELLLMFVATADSKGILPSAAVFYNLFFFEFIHPVPVLAV